jgi:hypothetical protein
MSSKVHRPVILPAVVFHHALFGEGCVHPSPYQEFTAPNTYEERFFSSKKGPSKGQIRLYSPGIFLKREGPLVLSNRMFLVVFWLLVGAPVHAATLAFTKGDALYLVGHKSSITLVAQNVKDYQVGELALAYRVGSRLFFVNAGGWLNPIFLADNVDSYTVGPGSVVYQSQGVLYRFILGMGEATPESIAKDVSSYAFSR